VEEKWENCVLVGALGGNDLSGPNSLEIYKDTLYWGNTEYNNLAYLPLSLPDPSTSSSSSSSNALENGNDVNMAIDSSTVTSSWDRTPDNFFNNNDDNELDPEWEYNGSTPELPSNAKHQLLHQNNAVHGLCIVPVHDWILWLDWSRDVLVIMALDGTTLHTSEKVGMPRALFIIIFTSLFVRLFLHHIFTSLFVRLFVCLFFFFHFFLHQFAYQ
jgi:hypothetical protein